MDYAEAHAAFFYTRPATDPPPATDSWDTPARHLRDAIERIALVELWSKQGSEAMAAIGLDFLGGYVWGRASAFEDAPTAVAGAAFAVFEPSMIDAILAAARAVADANTVRGAKLAGALAALRSALGDDDAEVTTVVEILRRGLAAAELVGRPLFAGLSAQPWPTEPIGQLWRAVNLLREFRGDTHVAVCVAAGLNGAEMNVLTERWIGWAPRSYSATRGWSAEALAAAYDRLGVLGWLAGDDLTAHGLARREELEALTDAGLQPIVEAMGSDLDTVIAAGRRWSELLVAADAVPSDPYKMAAG